MNAMLNRSRQAPLHTLVLLLALAAPASAALAADTLGRLFFTPAERTAAAKPPSAKEATKPVVVAPPVPAGPVELNGIVRRSSGRSTVWINGQPVNDRGTGTATTVAPLPSDPARAEVTPSGSRRLTIAVGESVDPASGERNPGIGPGRVVAAGADRPGPARIR